MLKGAAKNAILKAKMRLRKTQKRLKLPKQELEKLLLLTMLMNLL